MIVKKTWERLRSPVLAPRERSFDGNGKYYPMYHDEFTGWFLFGIFPLYIVRERTALAELNDRL